MKKEIINIVIPSMTAVIGATAVGIYCLNHFNRRFAVLERENRSLAERNLYLEHRNDSLLTALHHSNITKGVLERVIHKCTFERDDARRELNHERSLSSQTVARVSELEEQRHIAETRATKDETEKNELARQALHLRTWCEQVQKREQLAEATAAEAEAEKNKYMQHLNESQSACNGLQEDLEHSEAMNSHLRHIIANKAERLSDSKKCLRNLQNELEEKNAIIELLKTQVHSEEGKVAEKQALLHSCEELFHNMEATHQAQLTRCAEEIYALQTQLDGVYREVKAFLTKHPHIDIDIALTLHHERLQSSSPLPSSCRSS